MATLNIGGQRVTVDDAFLSMTPEQQNATVEEISQGLGARQPQQPAAPLQQRVMTQEAFSKLPRETQQRMINMGVQVSANAPTSEHYNFTVDYNDRGSALDPLVQGTTMGWADELRGQAQGGMAALQGGDYNDARKQAEVQSRIALGNYREDHPVASTALEIAGAIPTAVVGGGGAAAQGANLLTKAAMGGLVGAGQGFVYGGGAADQDKLGGALNGAAWGGGIGAAIPVVGGALSAGARTVSNRVSPFIRGARNPQEEAARRVGQSRALDNTNPGSSVMTQADEAIARENNLPVMNVDRGGEATRGTFRAVSNTNPEARDLARQAVDGRYQQQWKQTQDFFDRMMGGNVSNLERNAQINATAREVNSVAYMRAFSDPAARQVWNRDLQSLLQSDAIQNAISKVGTRSSNRAAASGQMPIRNPFRLGSDGKWRVVQQANGTTITPNLQFWDQIKRNLQSQIGVARRAGDDELERDLMGLKNKLVNNLDGLVPSYSQARSGAKAFFDAEDAVEAGRNAWSHPKAIDESLEAIGQLSAAEKADFGIGLVSQIMDDIRAPTQSRNSMLLFDSPARMQVLEAALGAGKARQVEGFVRVQNILNRTRNAITGISTTASQLKEMGVLQAAGQQFGTGGLGAVGGLLTGGDINSATTGAVLALAARHGAAKIGRSVDDQVMRHMAELLVSGNDAAIQKAMAHAMMSPRHMDVLKAIGAGLDQALRTSAIVGATGN